MRTRPGRNRGTDGRRPDWTECRNWIEGWVHRGHRDKSSSHRRRLAVGRQCHRDEVGSEPVQPDAPGRRALNLQRACQRMLMDSQGRCEPRASARVRADLTSSGMRWDDRGIGSRDRALSVVGRLRRQHPRRLHAGLGGPLVLGALARVSPMQCGSPSARGHATLLGSRTK